MKIVSILLMLFLASDISAQNNLPVYDIVSDTGKNYELKNSQYQVLYDTLGKYSFNDVINSSLQQQFITDTTTHTTKQRVKAYWVRFKFRNLMPRSAEISLEAEFSKFDLFIQHTNGTWEHKRTGKSIPWNQRDGFKADLSLPLIIKPGEEIIVYERQQNIALLNYNMPVVFFTSTKNINEEYIKFVDNGIIQSEIGKQSFFLGILVLAFVINLLFFLIVKERVYLYYSLYLMSLALSRSSTCCSNITF